MTSFEVTPSCSSPSTEILMLLLFFCHSVCVARTCSTSEVPIPNARAPNAPWADNTVRDERRIEYQDRGISTYWTYVNHRKHMWSRAATEKKLYMWKYSRNKHAYDETLFWSDDVHDSWSTISSWFNLKLSFNYEPWRRSVMLKNWRPCSLALFSNATHNSSVFGSS
jgi:hypothetical protein